MASPAPLAAAHVASRKLARFLKGPFVTQRVGRLGENISQDRPLIPLLESARHRLVGGIALREQGPLHPGVQHPEHRVQDGSGWDRCAARTSVRDVCFRKMVPKSFPVIVAQPQYGSAYTDRPSCCQ